MGLRGRAALSFSPEVGLFFREKNEKSSIKIQIYGRLSWVVVAMFEKEGGGDGTKVHIGDKVNSNCSRVDSEFYFRKDFSLKGNGERRFLLRTKPGIDAIKFSALPNY